MFEVSPVEELRAVGAHGAEAAGDGLRQPHRVQGPGAAAVSHAALMVEAGCKRLE